MSIDLDLLAAASSALAYGEGLSVPWARIVLAFLLCVGLAVAAIAFMRWRTGQGAPRPFWLQMGRGAGDGQSELELLDRLALSPTTQLVAVRWGEKKLLVLASPAGAWLIDEREGAVSAETAT